MERYLQLCADGNKQICNVTTPAQYFHLLRRQMRQPPSKPLVLFTPKSLLRLPASASPLEELASGGFRACLEDAAVSDRGSIERVLLCSGKVYYDLLAEREKRGRTDTAIVRLEQLYPFPQERLKAILAGCPRMRQAVWVQEEPRNMGAWTFVHERSGDFLPSPCDFRYVGRPAAPSPATGNAAVHKRELEQFLAEAFAES
jgi:2-oxoglutarate dehydrogenase complex dehydrogenase (E1) component-like enzyme